MGKMSRTKGASFEREIATTMRQVFPGARRGLGQARSAREVPDVDGTPYWIECKNHRRVNIQKAFAQATTDTDAARAPVVVSKDLRTEVLVTMALSTFLALLGAREETQPSHPEADHEPHP
jgi:hypothetical protein